MFERTGGLFFPLNQCPSCRSNLKIWCCLWGNSLNQNHLWCFYRFRMSSNDRSPTVDSFLNKLREKFLLMRLGAGIRCELWAAQCLTNHGTICLPWWFGCFPIQEVPIPWWIQLVLHLTQVFQWLAISWVVSECITMTLQNSIASYPTLKWTMSF